MVRRAFIYGHFVSEGLGYLLTYNHPQDVIEKFAKAPRFSQEAFVNMALDLKRPSHQLKKQLKS